MVGVARGEPEREGGVEGVTAKTKEGPAGTMGAHRGVGMHVRHQPTTGARRRWECRRRTVPPQEPSIGGGGGAASMRFHTKVGGGSFGKKVCGWNTNLMVSALLHASQAKSPASPEGSLGKRCSWSGRTKSGDLSSVLPAASTGATCPCH